MAAVKGTEGVAATSAPPAAATSQSLDTVEQLNCRACRILGIIQMVLGSVAVLLEIVHLVFAPSGAQGIWVGVFVSGLIL